MGESKRPTVYIASKTVHAPRWRRLRALGVRVVSTWIDEAGPGETKDRADLWGRCIGESMRADAFLLYVEPGETLKGALVEMGAALAMDRPVLWVGPVGEYTATSHPHVRVYSTIIDALDVLAYGAAGQEASDG